MKTLFAAILLVLSVMALSAQDIRVVDYQQLKPYLEKNNDTTYVVNFWATWCLPCVKEMPYFQKIHDQFAGRGVKVLLVSLDFVNHIDSRLKPFIQKHQLTPEVIVLNDPDANSWISQVNPAWSGALPATLVYNRQSVDFYEKSFTYEELEQIVKQKLENK